MGSSRLAVGLCLLGTIAAVVAYAASPSDTKIGRCLPVNGDISGWEIVSGSYKYGSGNGISDIYNGGYEKLIEAGMTKACTQTYRNGNRRINVYADEFETASQAKSYTEKQTSGTGWTAVGGAPESAKYKATSSVVIGHLYRGKVHSKVVAQGTSTEQVEAVKAFLKKISARIASNY